MTRSLDRPLDFIVLHRYEIACDLCDVDYAAILLAFLFI